MANKRIFLKQFLKEKQMVGAISSSSKYLGAKMLDKVDFDNSRVLVELGPGTGVFTQLIIDKMSADSILLVFELNDHFFEQLTKRFNDPRVHLIHDTAENIQEYLDKHNLHKADVIISSLPLAVFPRDLRNRLLTASHDALKENGTYVQFQYSLQSWKNLERTFRKVSIGFTMLNLPPAFVYTCLKKS